MKNYILAAVLSTMYTGAVHAGASPEDIDLVTKKAEPAVAAATAATEEKATDVKSERFFDFYASDKAAQLRYETDGSRFQADDSRLSLGYLISEQRDNVFTLGLAVETLPKLLPGVTFSFGGKVYAALLGIENNDVVSVAAGIEAGYELPLEKFPLQLDASVHYAPDVLTFGRADRVIDWQFNVGLPLRETITGYVGFRFIQFDTQPGDREVDDRIHLGFRWAL